MRRAFTLIELLVVVGIIAILIALLLPVLSGVQQQSRRVVCQSNVRQIITGMRMYSQHNRDLLPSTAPLSMTGYPEDWIYWQSYRDLKQSALSPYMTMSVGVLRCPSDNIDAHLHPQTGPYGPYNYSYALNQFFGTYGGSKAPKFSRIKRASELIMLVDEEDTGIDDGMWCPGGTDFLSTVHDKTARREKQNVGMQYINLDSRGVVGYADGHVGYVSKREAHNPKSHYPRT